MRMLLAILLSSSLAFAVGFVGCAQTTDPKINKQLDTIQLLQRLNEFQDTVTDLYNQKAINPDHALLYSRFVASATKTVKELPNGWVITLKTSWNQVKVMVPIDNMEPRIQITARLIDAFLNGL